MDKIAVIYWSATGNTEAMAKAVLDGILKTNIPADIFTVGEFGAKNIDDYSKIAFGCPSMGSEVLEESEFEPFFESIEASLPNKKTALFGSFGWGNGEWMRDWEERVKKAGAILFKEGLTVNLTPGAKELEQCADFGRRFAEF